MHEPIARHATSPDHPPLSRKKRVLFSVIVLAVVVAVSELVSHAVLFVIKPHLDREIRRTSSIYAEQSTIIRQLLRSDTARRDRFDPVLGWHYRRNYTTATDRINSRGLRGDREYELNRPDHVLRVAAFGDSFVYGSEVGYAEAWPWLLEQSDERLEILNYGVGGYGTDQAYLRYLAEGLRYSPQVVLICFAPIDLGRNVNRYRRFVSTREGPWVKPRFVLKDGALDLLPSPIQAPHEWDPFLGDPETVREFGVDDQWYEPLVYQNPLYDASATVRLLTNVYLRLRDRYFASDRPIAHGVFNAEAPAFEVTVALLQEFADTVRAAGATPVIVILPNQEEVHAARVGKTRVYSTLVEALREEKTWDLADAFAAAPPEADEAVWFMPHGHYSGEGNRIVAAWLGERLREMDLHASARLEIVDTAR